MIEKIISLFTAIIMFIFPSANIPAVEVDTSAHATNYTAVFVHGLGGWGEYEFYYDLMPYWGVMGGDLMKYLNARGFNCVAASVSPTASCWDRACELYAQLTGTRTDYGKEHSERCKHERYGKDYTGKALIDCWNAEKKINLFGHSFGGATILQLADLMADGSEAERSVTPDSEISQLFTGGKSDWIYSLTTLAAPMNGSTAYYIKDEINADPKADLSERLVATAVGALASPLNDGRDEHDCAGYDMEVDRAMSLCDEWQTQPETYYFSIPCCMTDTAPDGTVTADKKNFEPVYAGGAGRIAKWTGVTASGYVLDESWQPNDGLVNTVSAIAPYNAQRTDYVKGAEQPGIWNVMPVYRGDHMSLEGGLIKNNNVRLLYVDLLTMINNL